MVQALLGLDVGTTAIKAAAYDGRGRILARSQAPTATLTGAGGRAEQDMDAVWSVTAGVLRTLVEAHPELEIAALGVCAQGDGLWLVDADGLPTGRAVLWSDTRAAGDVIDLARRGASDAVGHACHTSLWPGTSGSIWHFLERHEPERTRRAAHALTCGDWIGFKLTGEIATDVSNASIPFLDFATRAYSPAALAALGCERLAPLLATPRRTGSRLGGLTRAAAAATGLPEGLAVAVPTLDLASMIVGMAMDRPGQTMMIMGTTAVVNILTDQVTPTGQPVGASAIHPTADTIIRILAPTTGAAAFDWFTGLHPLSLGGESSAEVADKLNRLVVEVPPGSNGVTFLPYLNGERAPFVAPQLTAAFHGLTARSTKADMGRAVMEGAAMSLRHCFELEDGLPTEPVQLTGGGARNPVWCQIIADLIGAPVVVSDASDHGLWGAAVLGAAAVGLGDPVALAARGEETRRFDPDPAAHALYDGVFSRYRRLSDAARAFADIP